MQAVVAELVAGHGCHTVILYGSRARGAATPASDYDLIGLWDRPGTLRIAHVRHGGYLDAFIHPEADVEGPIDDFLKLHGGQVLLQREGLGDRLLARVEARFQAGPVPWTPDVREANRAWAAKTLDRVAVGDVEGHYRRVMLLHDLLQDYFLARGRWYLGSKASLAWLAEHDAAAARAFAAALAPGAEFAAVAELVRVVWEGVAGGEDLPLGGPAGPYQA